MGSGLGFFAMIGGDTSRLPRRHSLTPIGRAARSLVGVAITLLLAAAPVAADSVDDLLFDLQMIPLDGQAAHEFSLPGLDDRPVALAELKGQVVLLYFWATW